MSSWEKGGDVSRDEPAIKVLFLRLYIDHSVAMLVFWKLKIDYDSVWELSIFEGCCKHKGRFECLPLESDFLGLHDEALALWFDQIFLFGGFELQVEFQFAQMLFQHAHHKLCIVILH